MHIGRLLRRPAIIMLEEVHARLEIFGYQDVKPAHGAVFSYIGEGAQVTQMAQAALTTKQNMSYLVDYLEKRGYVESIKHKGDGRAKMFRLTAKGKKCREKTIAIIKDISAEWEKNLGKEKMKHLMEMLLELNNSLKGGIPY
jgi:DNA-binding MarR family transcriptional regulator